MLFTSYRCRSCIQGRRMVHLLNCMLLLKSQMTYWAKVLLIAAGPSAQHPKLLLPPAEKNWQSLWSTQETGWIYSAVTSKEVCLYWFGTGRSGKFTSLKLTSTSPYCLVPPALARRQECCLGRLLSCPALPTSPQDSKRKGAALKLSTATSTKVHGHCGQLFVEHPLKKMARHDSPENSNVSTRRVCQSR